MQYVIYPYVYSHTFTTTINILTYVTMPSSISNASDASVNSLWSYIIVAVLPEDLAATCNSDYTLERCNLSTV
ncbi:hypothetical protein LX36DRAFT_656731 [Colletotrichum falcatum]|nr:hypothetical protein LX36DRAFT_656731 [Colletotrichum falcatum]